MAHREHIRSACQMQIDPIGLLLDEHVKRAKEKEEIDVNIENVSTVLTGDFN